MSFYVGRSDPVSFSVIVVVGTEKEVVYRLLEVCGGGSGEEFGVVVVVVVVFGVDVGDFGWGRGPIVCSAGSAGDEGRGSEE